jgi:hypothetical protein
MAGASEIRAKEARAQLTLAGQPLGGSFSTIHDLAIKPDAEIAKKRFTGEKRFRGDIDVKGWDFSFKTEKTDHLWQDLWDIIQQAELNGDPLPEITLDITYSYRDGSRLLKTVSLHGDLIIKMDENSIPKDGYQMNSWSGVCSYNTGSQG